MTDFRFVLSYETKINHDCFLYTNGISIFMGYLMPEKSLEKNSSDYIKPTANGITEFIPFPKVNIIVRLGVRTYWR